MSGITAASAIGMGISAARAISGAVSGPGGGTSASGGGGQDITTQQYVRFGPHISTDPMSGKEQAPKPTEMTAPKAAREQSATGWNLRATPTQAVGQEQAKADFQNVWADRLSKYLDYNTRSLG